MGETSQAKVPPSSVVNLEMPTCEVDIQLRQKNKSSDKHKPEKCTFRENAPIVTTPTTVLFTDSVSTKLQKFDAPVLTSEAVVGEVGRILILLVNFHRCMM